MQASEDGEDLQADGLIAAEPAVRPRPRVAACAHAAPTMAAFLRETEARAYRIALVSVRDADDALDIVQDAMIRLVRRYAGRPAEEWRPLFYRILSNRVRDWQRRRKVRARFMSFFSRGAADDEPDPLASVPGPAADDPLERLSAEDAMAALERALRALPARQREVFMLRVFEGMDVAQTAAAMGCSKGSVKTHHSRALGRLREVLGDHR